jgi:DNA-binding transcriptional LysR family regulator
LALRDYYCILLRDNSSLTLVNAYITFMPPAVARQRAYKEITLQQLRSFYETARLGSLTAAAEFLDLAHPTVWQQVHALERQFGHKLIEPSRRGCRLTPAGRLLADMAGPSVLSIGSLRNHFREALAEAEAELIVAATPRVMVEELPGCVREFGRRFPRVRLTLKEMRDELISGAIESGEADLGLTPVRSPDFGRPWLASRWVVFEPCYELDNILITPKGHPLARRQRVQPRDLRGYPLVNGPTAFLDPTIKGMLDRLGILEFPSSHRVEAFFAATIRRYVELGFGIGLIGGRPGQQPHPRLHERVMSHYFGRSTIFLGRRKGAPQTESALAFVQTVRLLLSPGQASTPKSSRRTGEA